MRKNNTYLKPPAAFAYRVKAGRPPTPPVTHYHDLKGQRFGCLTVGDYLKTARGKAWWSCQCDCLGPASQIIVRSDKLTGGQTKSCKCGRGYAKSGPKPQPTAQPPVPRPRASAKVHAPPGEVRIHPPRPEFTPAELAAAETQSARQMLAAKVPLSEIKAYLALSRGGSCTYVETRQLLGLPEYQPKTAASRS